MSTKIWENAERRVTVTRIWGGSNRGVVYQIDDCGDNVQLTRADAVEMASAIIQDAKAHPEHVSLVQATGNDTCR